MLMAVSILIAHIPDQTGGVRSSAFGKGQLRATPKSRVGKPVVWSAESALLLIVQPLNPEPVEVSCVGTGLIVS
jgi:hypothetical protein